MISKILDEDTISFIAEESDDLLTIRRLIKNGDKIVGETTRVLKQEKEYSRPDKGERIKIRLAIEVEKGSLDDVLDRIRVGGSITESNNDAVPHGSHHSFIVKIDQPFNLVKKKWTQIEKKIATKKQHGITFVLVAIDTGDCGIGRLKGTHLYLLPNIYSGASGKRYKSNFKIEKFFDDVVKVLSTIVQKDDTVIIFGPGETRKKFGNFLSNGTLGQKIQIKVVEGVDSGGEDGIHIFTKSDSMKEIMSDSKLAKVSKIIDQIMFLANKTSKKFSMGLAETRKANEFGAIESLVFSEKAIQDYDEQEVIDFLNDVESKGGELFSVDSSTDVGLRVSGLGGIIALLRFPVGG